MPTLAPTQANPTLAAPAPGLGPTGRGAASACGRQDAPRPAPAGTPACDPLSLIRDASIPGLDARRFECLPGCGRCCGFKVSLLGQDIARLEDAGASAAEFVDEGREPASGFRACLVKRDGFCLFLDGGKRCREYESRPLSCRVYPYVRETWRHTQLDVCFACPGVGRGEARSDAELAGTLALDGSPAEHERLVAARRQSARAVEELLGFRVRLEPFEEMVADVVAAAEGGLGRLRELLKSRQSQLVRTMLPGRGSAVGQDAARADPAAEALLCGWLRFWARRQALWRWTDAFLAVTPGVRSRSEAFCSFLSDLADAATARGGAGADTVDQERARTAVRECDGAYRTYCQGFGMEV